MIADSAPEVFLVALRTYVALNPAARVRDALPECEAGVDAIRASRLYHDFVEMMPLGNRAEDFGVELSALESAEAIRDQAEYDAYFARQSPGFLEDFHRAFYQERWRFQRDEPERWDALVAPYPEFMAALHELAERLTLTIATAKDGPSVQRLLKRFGADSLFPEGRVFDKETGRDKRHHLTAIGRACGVGFEEICFVDDKVNHLLNVEALGVRCVLAGWGYNGPREQSLAATRGFAVCTLDSAVRMLAG